MSEIRATTISDETGNGPITLTKQSAAKAWFSAVNWAVPDNSFNVSSMSDVAAGQSFVFFTNSFSDDTYTISGSSTDADGIVIFVGSKVAANCPVRHYGGLAGTAGYVDREMTADFHGDLA